MLPRIARNHVHILYPRAFHTNVLTGRVGTLLSQTLPDTQVSHNLPHAIVVHAHTHTQTCTYIFSSDSQFSTFT